MTLLDRLFHCFHRPLRICPYTPSLDELYPQGVPKARLVRQCACAQPRTTSTKNQEQHDEPLLGVKDLSAVAFSL